MINTKLLSVLGIFLVLSMSTVSAEIDLGETNADAGITPDSILYGLDTAIDNIRLRLSNNPTIGLKIANERLAELSKMISENKTEYIEEIEQNRERAVERARQYIKDDDEKSKFEFALNSQKEFMNKLKENLSQKLQNKLQNGINQIDETKEKIKNFQVNQNNECSKDSDCVRVQTTCCPCSSGGKEVCVPKSEKEKHEVNQSKCSKNQICIAMYNCNENPCSCESGNCNFSK
ncbi:MAG: DUF5667 domain-containing protein [Bacillota bacterium]